MDGRFQRQTQNVDLTSNINSFKQGKSFFKKVKTKSAEWVLAGTKESLLNLLGINGIVAHIFESSHPLL